MAGVVRWLGSGWSDGEGRGGRMAGVVRWLGSGWSDGGGRGGRMAGVGVVGWRG